jgi:hypothetical protein
MKGCKIETGPFPVFAPWQVQTDEIATTNRINTKMKITLNTYQIADELKRDTYARWSYNGSLALAKYLEEYEADNGEETELDVCAIRCDFSETTSLQDWIIEHFGAKSLLFALELADIEFDDLEDSDEIDAKIREYIQDHGTLIEFEGGIIVSSF